MTVSESRKKLRWRYVQWYTRKAINNIDIEQMIHDAKYSWWEKEKSCEKWCNKEKVYVPMSETKTLKIMRDWFKVCKSYG